MDGPLAPFDIVRREERVGPHRLMISRPRSAEDLIDEDEYARDERLPYWAELWPSAHVLAEELAARDLSGVRAIELGCGVGLPSVVAALGGAEVTATDWYDDALIFARVNAQAAGARIEARILDWNLPAGDVLSEGPWHLVVGADLLYEARNGPALAALLPRLLAPGAEALITDPRRPHADGLLDPLLTAGWRHEMTPVHHPARPDEAGPVVNLHRLRPPGR